MNIEDMTNNEIQEYLATRNAEQPSEEHMLTDGAEKGNDTQESVDVSKVNQADKNRSNENHGEKIATAENGDSEESHTETEVR